MYPVVYTYVGEIFFYFNTILVLSPVYQFLFLKID